MAITYPYSLATFFDLLSIQSCVFDVERYDESSGSGDGRDWQAELAPPLWIADVRLNVKNWQELKKIQALLRKLKGSQESFWLCDPTSLYPASDPDGSILGVSTVQVQSVGANRDKIRFKGLPSTFALKAGDKFSIQYGSSPYRYYFGEVSEDVTAVAGVTPEFDVFMNVPVGVVANDPVTLKKPACKMALVSYDAGETEAVLTRGLSFRARERKR